jgi:hypothetical protein
MPNLACVFLKTIKRLQGHQNSEKRDLVSKTGEDIFCMFESKHDRRTALRPELIVSAKNL